MYMLNSGCKTSTQLRIMSNIESSIECLVKQKFNTFALNPTVKNLEFYM